MRKFLIFAVITVFALTGVASARGPGSGKMPDVDEGYGGSGKFWQRERVSEELSLSEEEMDQLAGMQTSHREKVQGLRDDLGKELESLKEIMDSAEMSSSDARQAFKRAEKIRSMIQAERFELRLSHRQLLGKERFAKLREMEKRAMQRKRKGRQ